METPLAFVWISLEAEYWLRTKEIPNYWGEQSIYPNISVKSYLSITKQHAYVVTLSQKQILHRPKLCIATTAENFRNMAITVLRWITRTIVGYNDVFTNLRVTGILYKTELKLYWIKKKSYFILTIIIMSSYTTS